MNQITYKTMDECLTDELHDALNDAEIYLKIITPDEAASLNYYKGQGMKWLNPDPIACNAAPFPKCNNAEGCFKCEHQKEESLIICELCHEPVNQGDLATYAMPDGSDDFCPEPAHSWCVQQLEEQEYRMSENNPDDIIT